MVLVWLRNCHCGLVGLINNGSCIKWPLKRHNIPPTAKAISSSFNACMMLPGFIFCAAVLLATLTVILLALVSPVPERKPSPPWLDLSLYIQQPHIASSNVQQAAPQADTGAFIFHRKLTEGPENTSRVVGKAQGFIIPMEDFAQSAFNIIYLTFHTPEYSGSLSVQAKHVSRKDREELTVMGGTGSFAFARGLAVFAQSDQQLPGAESTYHVKLQLRFPNQSRTTLG